MTFAADIRPQDPVQIQNLKDFLKSWEYTDQLLTDSSWLYISWSPFDGKLLTHLLEFLSGAGHLLHVYG